MTTISDCKPTVPGAFATSSAGHGQIKNQIRSTLRYGCYGALLALVVPTLFYYQPDKSIEEIAQLERLAPQIERAQALAPEAKETVVQLIARQRARVGSGHAELESRRTAAIDRVSRAIKAKSAAAMASHAPEPITQRPQ